MDSKFKYKMKKVVYLLTLAVVIAMAACNTGNESSASKSDDASASSDNAVSMTSAANVEVASVVQETNEQASGVAAEPDASQPKMQPPKAPMTPEEAEKYKEATTLLRTYGQEMLNCLDAKNNGQEIDAGTKQRISEIQKKLAELQKAGKMNRELIELYNSSNDTYNKILAK